MNRHRVTRLLQGYCKVTVTLGYWVTSAYMYKRSSNPLCSCSCSAADPVFLLAQPVTAWRPGSALPGCRRAGHLARVSRLLLCSVARPCQVATRAALLAGQSNPPLLRNLLFRFIPALAQPSRVTRTGLSE